MKPATRAAVVVASVVAVVAAGLLWTRSRKAVEDDNAVSCDADGSRAAVTLATAPRLAPPASATPREVPIVEHVDRLVVVANVSSQSAVRLDGLRVEADVVADGQVIAALGRGTTDASGRCALGPFAVPAIRRSLVPTPSVTRGYLFDPFVVSTPTAHAVLRVRASGRPDVRVDDRTVTVADLAEPTTPDWGPTVVDGADGVRTVTVPLTAETDPKVCGRVLDRSGAPLDGAYLRVPGADRWFGVRADQEGRFEHEITSSGSVRFEVSFPWFSSYAAAVLTKDVEVAPGPAVTTVDFVVDPLVTIEGRVEGEDGRPVVGAPLALVTAGDDVEKAHMWMSASSMTPVPPYHVRTRSTAGGAFRFVGLPSDRRFSIRWWDDGRQEQAGPADLAAGAKDVVVRVSPRHGIRVRCVDAETAEPVDAYVNVSSFDGSYSNEELSWSDPGEEGFRGKPGERLSFVVQAARYDSMQTILVVPKDEGIADVVVRLTAARSRAIVEVRAVDEDGRAWPRCPDLRWWVSGRKASVDPRATAGPADTFSTRDLSPGGYELGVGYDALGIPSSGELRFATSGSASFDVPAEGRVPISLTLPRGGALRVHLRDRNGKALSPGDMTSLAVRDADGNATELRLFTKGEHRSRPGEPVWGEGVGGEVPHETQALVPGIYTVEWTGGFHRGAPVKARATTRVLAGQVVDVEVVLDG